MVEVVAPNFILPNLPKYDGTKDPQEHGFKLEVGVKLDFEVTNNETEYKALIAELKLAQQMKAKKLIVCIDL